MINKINWKQKLSSRKLWASAAGFVTGVILLCRGEGDVNGVIMALGSVIAYIVGESKVDARRGDGR